MIVTWTVLSQRKRICQPVGVDLLTARGSKGEVLDVEHARDANTEANQEGCKDEGETGEGATARGDASQGTVLGHPC